jgi:hypothetical protein
MKYLLILNIFLYISIKETGVEAIITCRGGSYKVTGDGDACCTLNFYRSGSVYGGSEVPYDSKTQSCCIQYSESARARIGRVGYGDSCCGAKIYNKTTHGCCSVFLPAARDYIYSPYDLATSCCKFGVVYDGNKCYPTSDNYKNNNALLLRSKRIYFIFIFIFFIS